MAEVVGGRELPTLSVPDELLVLGLHGSLHLWTRLAWVMDLVTASNAAGDHVLDQVLSATERLGVRICFATWSRSCRRSGAGAPRWRGG